MNASSRNASFRNLVVCAAMAALALALPIAFHMAGLGSEFLPMLLPLLVNAFLVPFVPAVAMAAVAPFISALATGMPPLYPPIAVVLGGRSRGDDGGCGDLRAVTGRLYGFPCSPPSSWGA